MKTNIYYHYIYLIICYEIIEVICFINNVVFREYNWRPINLRNVYLIKYPFIAMMRIIVDRDVVKDFDARKHVPAHVRVCVCV